MCSPLFSFIRRNRHAAQERSRQQKKQKQQQQLDQDQKPEHQHQQPELAMSTTPASETTVAVADYHSQPHHTAGTLPNGTGVGADGNGLPDGVYVPMLAFFTDSDEIDVAATQRHAARLLAAGVSGLVVHGSNGECAHLSRRERRTIIEAVADTIRHESDSLHAPVPLVAGCGAQSVRETVELCREARDAGATHALVLPPGYYAGIIGAEGVTRFFHAVADASPIPILIYNFPGAANGVDLTSDALLRIAAHPRIVGVKLTCGNTGKLARMVADAPRARAAVPPAERDFFVAGGSADFILQGLVAGGRGTISGLANLAPRACVRVGELFARGRLAEARALQHELARADWLAIRYGFVGVKAAMSMFHGVGEYACAAPRAPFVRLGEDAVKEIGAGMAGLVEIETKLAAEDAVGDEK